MTLALKLIPKQVLSQKQGLVVADDFDNIVVAEIDQGTNNFKCISIAII